MRGDYRKCKDSLGRANALLVETYLAGRLDTRGHKVEVREKIIAGHIIKSLFIDGEG